MLIYFFPVLVFSLASSLSIFYLNLLCASVFQIMCIVLNFNVTIIFLMFADAFKWSANFKQNFRMMLTIIWVSWIIMIIIIAFETNTNLWSMHKMHIFFRREIFCIYSNRLHSLNREFNSCWEFGVTQSGEKQRTDSQTKPKTDENNMSS